MIEGVGVAVFGVERDVALAVRHLILTRCVIGHVRITDVFNVANHAVENLSHLHVGVVIDGDDLGPRPVLTHVVGHLTDVLRQFVDCERRACVDRLTLHRATGGQHVSGPLPVIVG